MPRKSLSGLDLLLAQADRALKTLASATTASRPSPAGRPLDPPLDESERRHAAGLMRVNHAGEIAAQALYQGQALTARGAEVREKLHRAAEEEGDHLAWCEERLRELDSRTSVLNPLWYAGSFAIGALAGALGDRVSLGFVAETERQVEGHLDEHLQRLPRNDERSRRVLAQMKADETRHGENARAAGARELPAPVKLLMKLTSRVMTRTAYWI
ncbi:MAG TPA: 2-polyprenyl-3-methyl-6-methoxy-1,4-benzoquinone monooxygenase [Steroidobacteraceae bacterium]|nr:2-polyprenyl-3-methyl-6-methoxy-1,4-benzoquinone monooxygenase [Steroidobacteraceae bacterium]